MQNVLEVKNLTKKFGEFIAVDNISFSLQEGEILGLLGRNGAGKTTTLQMLLGVLHPSIGEIAYFGKNLWQHKEEILNQINFSSTYTNLPWILTVKENFNFISYLYDIKDRKKRIDKIIETFKLKPLINQQIQELSAGQLTRVNLAKSFINYPKVLLLDEPTASLDPDVAQYIREFLLNERKQFNVSIIITSHNMSEVEEVCDRVIFIEKGTIVANDKPEILARSMHIAHIELLIRKDMKDAKRFCEEKGLTCKVHGRYLTINTKEEDIAHLLQALSSNKIYYDEISIEKPTLEDYFLQVTKEKKDEAI